LPLSLAHSKPPTLENLAFSATCAEGMWKSGTPNTKKHEQPELPVFFDLTSKADRCHMLPVRRKIRPEPSDALP
jgi:hypothetical protein